MALNFRAKPDKRAQMHGPHPWERALVLHSGRSHDDLAHSSPRPSLARAWAVGDEDVQSEHRYAGGRS
jgi:hypothetical protein